MPLIVAMVLSHCLILFCWSQKKMNFEDAALLKGTSSFHASVENMPIHFSSIKKLELCLEGARKRNLSKQAFWVGNSQIHAVNQHQQGQENGPPILFRDLKTKDIDLLTFSTGNVNFQEYSIMLEHLQSKIPVNYLLLSAVFDDTRENNIRKEIKNLTDNNSNETSQNVNSGDTTLAINTQAKSEKLLDEWLLSNWKAWRLRSRGRGNLFLKLYHLRNFVFRINPQSKRPMIPSSYISNLNALENTLKTALKTNTNVLVYIAPIRNDVETPYIQDEYDKFKNDIKELSVSHGAAFANLEDLIPSMCWGQKDSTLGKKELELDFMHFTAEGHNILAGKLGQLINDNFIAQAVTSSTK